MLKKLFTNAMHSDFLLEMGNRRFLLKSPFHLLMLDSLLEVYPDASFIYTNRSVMESLPSYISLMKHTRIDKASFNHKTVKRYGH